MSDGKGSRQRCVHLRTVGSNPTVLAVILLEFALFALQNPAYALAPAHHLLATRICQTPAAIASFHQCSLLSGPVPRLSPYTSVLQYSAHWRGSSPDYRSTALIAELRLS